MEDTHSTTVAGKSACYLVQGLYLQLQRCISPISVQKEPQDWSVRGALHAQWKTHCCGIEHATVSSLLCQERCYWN